MVRPEVIASLPKDEHRKMTGAVTEGDEKAADATHEVLAKSQFDGQIQHGLTLFSVGLAMFYIQWMRGPPGPMFDFLDGWAQYAGLDHFPRFVEVTAHMRLFLGR